MAAVVLSRGGKAIARWLGNDLARIYERPVSSEFRVADTVHGAMGHHKVFVYGTLKRGEPNHHLFTEDGANGKWKFVGEGTTVEKFPLIIGTKYNIPFLLHNPGHGMNVQGEIYDVDDTMLKALDELEEHPDFYEREVQPISLVDNTKVDCWIYFLKKYRPELLTRTLFSNYSSKGDHGLEYIESEDNLLDQP